MEGIKKPSALKLISGVALLSIGFVALIRYDWAWWALFVGGLFAWIVVFEKDGVKAFRLPKRIWVIPLGVVGYFAISLSILELSKLIGMEWVANPLTGQLVSLLLRLPIMMMGEELLGIGILEAAKAKGISLRNSTLLSALIFGLLHLAVYWDGSILSSVAHVLLLQGVSRLIFNYVYIKTRFSIWGSWATHILVDIIALYVGGL